MGEGWKVIPRPEMAVLEDDVDMLNQSSLSLAFPGQEVVVYSCGGGR